MGGLSNGLIPDPPRQLTPQTGGGDRKIPLWNCSQIGDHRLSTTCGVVERPDHHCGYDLVIDTYVDVMNVLLIASPWCTQPGSSRVNYQIGSGRRWGAYNENHGPLLTRWVKGLTNTVFYLTSGSVGSNASSTSLLTWSILNLVFLFQRKRDTLKIFVSVVMPKLTFWWKWHFLSFITKLKTFRRLSFHKSIWVTPVRFGGE